uniref:Putative ovule protein n=1 Tax=Solanum chacoense TaxID=4108 RepID=A0A0V0GRK8_SOLCH
MSVVLGPPAKEQPFGVPLLAAVFLYSDTLISIIFEIGIEIVVVISSLSVSFCIADTLRSVSSWNSLSTVTGLDKFCSK